MVLDQYYSFQLVRRRVNFIADELAVSYMLIKYEEEL